MAAAYSFDVTSTIEMPEVENAVNQARKEIGQRFDFKGSIAKIELDQKANTITLSAEDNFKIESVWDVLQTRLIKRDVAVKNLKRGDVEGISGGAVKQVITLQQGIPIEAAKDLYSSPAAAFRRVTLPLSAPGIIAGTLLTFIPAVGDYVNAFFLGGPNNTMLGNTIQGLYLNTRDYPAAAALSFVLMAVIMVIVFVYIRFAGSEALMGEEATPV